MFIIKKILKYLNKKYYIEYQQTNMSPINENVSEDMIKHHIRIAEGDMQMKNMLEDVLNLRSENKDFEFSSDVGKKASNELKILNSRIEKTLESSPAVIKEVINILKMNSSKSCLVGGAVRNSFLGKKPKDFDFVTDIDYCNLASIFEYRKFKVKETGKKFLVLNVIKDGIEIEIANYRKDGTYEDGRRPEKVEIGNIDDDARRRDFSINAIYYDLTNGIIKDPTGQGIDDMLSKTLRFIGKPEDRIEEDTLRVFRFYRFLHQLDGFEAAPKSLKAVRSLFNNVFGKTTPERARIEIEKMAGL